MIQEDSSYRDTLSASSHSHGHGYGHSEGQVEHEADGDTLHDQGQEQSQSQSKSQQTQAQDQQQSADSLLEDMDPRDLRWAWVEVERKAIIHNVREFKKRIGARPMVLATVKADAYGHGAVQCAKIALSAGATWLGVATVEEGVELRHAGINDPILILSQPPAATIPVLLAFNLVPSVYTVEFAIALGEVAAAHGKVADFHLAINTGMNRIGVWCGDVGEFVSTISFHRGINMQGVFTHFATADCGEDYAFRLQLKRFCEAVACIHDMGIKPRIVHCANSAAGIRYKDSNFDMARLGISMYGLHPSNITHSMIDLMPAMSVHARVTAVNKVPVGEGVGYGLTYRSAGGVKIATIPVGYADGLPRAISNHSSVLFKGKLLPQVGNICMDQCMFEVDLRSTLLTSAVDVEIGEEVLLVGSQGEHKITLDSIASQIGTINYELACRFGMRMPRIYV